LSASPCWVQVEPERAYTHTDPTGSAHGQPSRGPPTSAMVPSAESATLSPKWTPKRASPTPVSFSPCWVQVESDCVNTHAAPRGPLVLSPSRRNLRGRRSAPCSRRRTARRSDRIRLRLRSRTSAPLPPCGPARTVRRGSLPRRLRASAQTVAQRHAPCTCRDCGAEVSSRAAISARTAGSNAGRSTPPANAKTPRRCSPRCAQNSATRRMAVEPPSSEVPRTRRTSWPSKHGRARAPRPRGLYDRDPAGPAQCADWCTRRRDRVIGARLLAHSARQARAAPAALGGTAGCAADPALMPVEVIAVLPRAANLRRRARRADQTIGSRPWPIAVCPS
jgi:hypothetical protein